MADVLDGAPFAQKLRVHRHAETGSVSLAGGPLERGNHGVVRRSRQDRAANHDDVIRLLVSERLAELLAHAREVRQVEAAVAAARRAHRDERDIARLDRLDRARGRAQPSSGRPRGDELVQARLDDRALTGVERRRPSSDSRRRRSTSWPSSANVAADTDPTYPMPNTEIFIDGFTRVIEVSGTDEAPRSGVVLDSRALVRDGPPTLAQS